MTINVKGEGAREDGACLGYLCAWAVDGFNAISALKYALTVMSVDYNFGNTERYVRLA